MRNKMKSALGGKTKKAFTLIELVFAIIIFTLILFGVLYFARLKQGV